MRRLFSIFLTLFCVYALLLSCGEETERFEVIDKLRALGVNPSVSLFPLEQVQKNPLQTELTAYVVLPKDQAIASIENFNDPSASFSLFPYQQVDQSSITYQQVGSLQIASFKIQVSTPALPDLVIAPYQSYVKLRYGFTVKAGVEEEHVVGDVLVLAPNNPLIAYKDETPVLSITSPEAGASYSRLNPLNLAAKIDKKLEETVKILWFVSSGKLKNNQSKTTEWTEMDTGKQSLIAVIFSKKTWRFQLAYREVEIIP